ncbi:MAG: bis(5'-nucleosyl)-tetraphosphatase (symmetrical) YqeK [Tissierellia bacterium]|nr:bis(5'-nucleosyl)-tetraphosphatase (symmetrical) YqeK [Tissierellia bacterium]
MNTEKDIIQRIGEKRFQHTRRVVEEAVRLARFWGADEKQARLAAYYHDCMKIRDKKLLFQACKDLGLELTQELKDSPEIIHGPLGALAARKYYGIKDEEVLHAIAIHTIGEEDMSVLDKIIYLADYIEPMRNFPGVEKARKLAYTSLDEAMVYALEHTISFLLDNKQVIALSTLKARNFYRKKVNQ